MAELMIISFAWTTPALLAGHKKRTRRDWTTEYAQKFHKGDQCYAYNRNPRNGGKPVAIIEHMADPYLQSTKKLMPVDYHLEGFMYLATYGDDAQKKRVEDIWVSWRSKPVELWVVDFKLVKLLGGEEDGETETRKVQGD